MVTVTVLAIHLLQTPPATAPAPQNPAPSRLIERQQIRPGRLDHARENLERDPNEPAQPAMATEPEAPSAPEAPAPAAEPPPPTPAPAAGLAPMAPTAMAPAPIATAPAAAPAKGAPAWLRLLPIGSPLAMLVGPGIGLLWLATRRQAAQ